ncbi:MAG TPA: class F sortase [Candidatus Saccharimonadales bacterium]|nr:class F sortase [Candidatus Saccharimonadales bacterium]
MQAKILLRRILLPVAVIGLAFFLLLFFYFIPKNQIQNSPDGFITNSVISSKQEQTDFGLPTRLKIPKINVDAAFEQVGLTPNGEMDIPKNQDNVAWFKLGPSPGENGSAVVAGHYGWKGGEPSVFDNLYKLRKGDKLYIEDDQGVIISFVVRTIRRFDPKADASDVFISSDGKSHLNLITCEGTWDKTSESYSQRLVIFTDKE